MSEIKVGSRVRVIKYQADPKLVDREGTVEAEGLYWAVRLDGFNYHDRAVPHSLHHFRTDELWESTPNAEWVPVPVRGLP